MPWWAQGPGRGSWRRPRVSLRQTRSPQHSMWFCKRQHAPRTCALVGCLCLCLYFLVLHCVLCFVVGSALLPFEMEGNNLVSVLPHPPWSHLHLCAISSNSAEVILHQVIFLLGQDKPNTLGPSGLQTPHSLSPSFKMSDKLSPRSREIKWWKQLKFSESEWITQRKILEYFFFFLGFYDSFPFHFLRILITLFNVIKQ